MSKTDSIFSFDTKVTGFEAMLTKLADEAPGTTNRNRTRGRGDVVAIAREAAEKAARDEGFLQGHADGYAHGLKEGFEKGRSDGFLEAADQRKQALAAFTTELAKVQQWFKEAIDEWFVESEQKMTDLAVKAAEAILDAELSISRETALTLVQAALREVTHARHARIRVNPFDSVLLQQHRAELVASSGSLRDIEIVDDPAIVGGCVIETDNGVVDATLTTQLQCFDHAIREAA